MVVYMIYAWAFTLVNVGIFVKTLNEPTWYVGISIKYDPKCKDYKQNNRVLQHAFTKVYTQ